MTRRGAGRTLDLRISIFMRARAQHLYEALISDRSLDSSWRNRAKNFVDLEPGRKVAWLWKSPKRGEPSLVNFFLEPKEEGCQVTLLHAGFPDTAEGRRMLQECRAVWESCLARLQ